MERGVGTGFGENMDPRGGEAERLYGGKGDLRSFSILSVDLSAVWQLDPDETFICVEGS